VTLAPLPDTQRTVEWDELPARVREIPADFDPLAEGVLMAHQIEWIRLIHRVQIAVDEKGRRTGITFATAQDDTITAASSKEAGGDNVWYMADSREKGLEYIGYCAAFARTIARGQCSAIEQHIFEDQLEDGTSRNITAYRIRFASGYRITALASRPENIHGLQGVVNLDEAALHKDVSRVLESATALLIWGGRIRVWSTHRGKKNAFYELVKDVRNGLYGDKAKAIRVTFDDAVANGLYERVCFMQGKTATPEGKREWYTSIRAAYGPRKAAMREELDAIPRDGSGAAIPSVWVEAAMPEERPIARLVLDDDFFRRPARERLAWGDRWIALNLVPLIERFDTGSHARWAVGMDFARHRHFSVILPARIDSALRRDGPFLVEMANVPQAQQEQVLWALLDRLRLWTFAGDATGPGQGLMERTGDHYGRADPATGKGGRVHEVVLSRAWYGEWMTQYIDLFEDGFIRLPRDASLEDDHRAVEYVDGVPMVPKLERRDLHDPELVRHGDGAIAGCLMHFASLQAVVLIDSQSTGPRETAALLAEPGAPARPATTDSGWGSVAGRADTRGF
jgi:phage FluMu gp28-like protein